MSNILNMIWLLFGCFVFPLAFGYPMTDNSSVIFSYLKYLEDRVDSLEEPVWSVSWDDNRWALCSRSGPCICDRNLRMLNCWRLLQEEGLPIQQIIPWDIEFIDLGENLVNLFSNTAFKHFTRLNELTMTNANLEHVPQHSLDRLTKLWHLRLSNNKIRTMDKDLIIKLRKLRTMDMSMNEVEEIPDQLFRSNADLTILMFSHNQIQVLSRNSFIGLKSLNHLDLSNNLINDVQKEAFGALIHLKFLDLSGNQIKNLSVFDNAMLDQLQRLDLSRNKLEHILAPTFKTLKTLQRLFINSNSLEELKLDCFPDGLLYLDASKNFITMLQSPNLSRTLKIKSLDLSSNNIDNIPEKVFATLKELEELNLSNNMLTHLEFFPQLPNSVAVLDLRTNLIETLTKTPEGDEAFELEIIEQLKTVYMSGNLWNCTCTLMKNLSEGQMVQDRERLECSSPADLEFQPLLTAVSSMNC